jgi:hypothetical protein
MKRASIDIAAELLRLESLSNFELRGEWRRLHHMQPPKSLSRELLLRGITYKFQERAFGGLSKSILRRLSGTEPEASSPENERSPPRTTVKPGTRLVREWNGDTYTVLVHASGVEWRGMRYRSLSVVAREITGAHWSGPRFFGLTAKKGAGDG